MNASPETRLDRGDAIWSPCAVCSSTNLESHLRVSGGIGSEGLIPTTDRFGTALDDIVRCLECGHMQLARIPSSEDLRESYSEAESFDYVDEERGQRATARRLLAEIEAVAPRGRLLDLGCWVGFLLSEAAALGWDAVGVEPSRFASEFARDRLGLNVRTEELFSQSRDRGDFDVVVMADVIEHLPQPGAALEHIKKALRPGGVIAMVLPDAGSRLARVMGARWWSVIPTHVHYFTRSSIQLLLAQRGYEVVRIGTAPKVFTVDYYLSRLGGYSDLLQRLATRVARGAGVADRLWAPDFGDRMLVIAAADRG